MSFVLLVMTSALWGQADAAGAEFPTKIPPLPVGTPAVAAPLAAADAPAVPARLRLGAAEILGDALSLPAGAAITGRPMPLLTVLRSVGDRPQQVQAVHAYWRLAGAIAEYRFAMDEDAQLSRLQPQADESAACRAARAAAAARRAEAEAEAVTAQHELAALMSFPPDGLLPLPADRPYVGPYRTYFQELFGTRPAPERAALIDRTLPLRFRAIESHATAIAAADDALDAAVTAQTAGRGRLAAVLAGVQEQGRQRRALVAAVGRYNHDIADYALTIMASPTAPDILVGMLIKQDRPAVVGVLPGEMGKVQPASYEEPVMAAPAELRRPNWPTRAVRPTGPVDAAPKPIVPSLPGDVLPGEAPPTAHEARKPLSTMQDASDAGRLAAEYFGRSPGLSLEECLRTSPQADRQRLLRAYWSVAEASAVCQACARHAETLDRLPALETDKRAVSAARAAAEAARLDAEADLPAAQYDLAWLLGQTGKATWPLAAALPFTGAFTPETASSPPSWKLRRLTAMLAQHEAGIHQRATAVIEADAASRAAVADLQSGRQSIDETISLLDRQTDETLALIHGLGNYNRTIIDYLAATLPTGTSDGKWLAAIAR